MGPDKALSAIKAQLRMAELEDLYENAPCGYLSLAPDGRIDRINATFLAWTGHDPDDLRGRRFQELLNVAGKIYFETHFAPLLRLQGFFNEVALELIAKDGRPIPVLVNAVEKRDSQDKPTFIWVTVFNATDRRRYERDLLDTRNALATANHELRAFYDTLPVGIFRSDAAGRIVQASRRFCTLLGVAAAEDWLLGIVAEDRSVTEQHLQRALRGSAPFSSRFRVAGGDGALRHIEMKAVPVCGAKDDAAVVVGVVEDVTEQVRSDAQRGQIERDTFVRRPTGGLAHNLNNILMVIMGNLEVLDDNLADRPELRRTIGASLVATERAAALVSRMLVYAGHSASRPDAIEIDPCLRSIEKELSSRFGLHHRLTCTLHAPGAVVGLDAHMVREAVEELVANALAAMPEGGEVRLSTRLAEGTAASDCNNVVLAVSDTGIGMDAATLAKAREPFFTTREVGQGVGLGLSLVDGVARIAGGALRLLSNPATGTTAEMHLPVANKPLT
jgi:PAS domain S-box-containing protein